MDRKLWDVPYGDDSYQHLNDGTTAFLLRTVIENGSNGHVDGPFVGFGAGGQRRS